MCPLVMPGTLHGETRVVNEGHRVPMSLADLTQRRAYYSLYNLTPGMGNQVSFAAILAMRLQLEARSPCSQPTENHAKLW